MEKTITIESNSFQPIPSQTDMSHLRDIEFSILFNMFNSSDSFEKVTKKLNVDDFTFAVNKKIFEYLVFYSKEVKLFGDTSKKSEIAINVYEIYNVHPITTLKILEGRTKHHESLYDFAEDNKESNLELDIFELLDFSKKRQEQVSKNFYAENNFSTLQVEDEYGFYNIGYSNGVVQEVLTTYIFHLPHELCDTFKHTFENIIPYVQKEDHEVQLIVDEDDPENVQALSLKKNINKIDQLERLIRWADENKIDKIKLPRNRGQLLEYSIMEEFDDCNIKTLPNELFTIKKDVFSFNFMKNQISILPDSIVENECSTLGLCHNHFSEFPKITYKMKKLRTLCLHGNKLTSLPDDIGNLKNLEHLTISNNDIEKLPSSISQIVNLKDLDIENTLINETSLEYIDFSKIEKISFDDRLLPYFIENFHRLNNIDTINLIHSKYKESDDEIKSLGLNYDHSQWMEDVDYKGHGCIVLSKKELEE